ncbi:NAD(P)/FAD-dependent oxidoreductase [Sporosarcina sp.]|uniref:flavin monoamine oxidase family protein n=1 Tax=Sporosarcina sp. TaxID=49982 RepID=UPI00262B03B9|nr:NAD(P)/FAD-dependent oxidoreductase [Sporosarcina sp.]
MKEPIIIVGAGVSGLRAASLLKSKGIAHIVLEARDRIGGRVLSEEVQGKPELGRFDLGPTWFWPQHEPAITQLVEELQLETIEQHTTGAFVYESSPHEPPERHQLPVGAVEQSMRLHGGIRSLVKALAATLVPGTVRLSTRVIGIHQEDNGLVTVSAVLPDGSHQNIHGRAVILAMPPRLIAHHIIFSPALPTELRMSLENQPTWMAGQAKVIAIYDHPFWRKDGLSGQGMSRISLLQEIHDATNEKGVGALFGFFGMPAGRRNELSKDKILELAVNQLTRMYGPAAEKPVAMLYKDWAIDSATAVADDAKPLTAFPAYGLPLSADAWGKTLQFAGTETSVYQGGHLEGALRSAERVVSNVASL